MTFDKWWEQHSYLSKDHAEVMYAEMFEFGCRVAKEAAQAMYESSSSYVDVEAIVMECMK